MGGQQAKQRKFQKTKEQIVQSTKSEIDILQSLRVGTQDYDFKNAKIIKEGGQALVFEVKSKIDGKTYAAKRLKYQIGYNLNERTTQAEAEREISGLRSLEHPFICKIVDIIKDKQDFPCVIMEKCNQSLQNIINEQPEKSLIPENYIIRIFTMIAIPLYYIHQKNIVHCDLKPGHVLQKFIGDKEIFLITDFGSSYQANSQALSTIKKSMTQFYASIEQSNEEEPHPAYDIWSIGIILYNLMAKKVPFPQIDIGKRIDAIRNNQREKLSESYSQSLRDLVDYCLTLDQTSRPSIEKILRNPIVRAELDNILNEFIPLTYEYSTAISAHPVLEQVIEIQCMLAKSTDYGLPLIDHSLLKVANTPHTEFLLQAELRAIQAGLQYKEKEIKHEHFDETFKGYVSEDDQKEGPGIRIFTLGQQQYGEYHLNQLHGCVKAEHLHGESYWGQFKHHEAEGYGTQLYASGEKYIGQLKQNKRHGYGINRGRDGEMYYGQLIQDKREGYGKTRYPDGAQYYGQFKGDKPQGEGVQTADGKVLYKVKYKGDELISATQL